MAVAVSQALKDAVIERCNPHCIAWAKANASLWGMSSSHDLDEPVCLSEAFPVRLRFADDDHRIITDREIAFTAERAATHIAVRFYFQPNKFFESDLIGVPHLNLGETATVRGS